MLKIHFVFILVALVVGCSTIERRSYYSPNVDPSHQVGPDEPPCGWTNFGGKPDKYVSKIDNKIIHIEAQQKFHPYFFGPWFASIVPVFPFTWLAELFASDTLTIRIYGDKDILGSILKENVSISCVSNEGKVTHAPSTIDLTIYEISLEFPVDYNDVRVFSICIKDLGKEHIKVEIPFIRTSRWSWTQWSQNC